MRWVPRVLRAAPFLGPQSLFLGLFVVVPIGLVTAYAFMTRGRFGGVAPEFSLDNITRLLEPVYLTVLVNSVGVAALTTLLALLLGFPTAYLIARLPSRWRTVALLMVLLPFWTNFLIRTYAWILLFNNAGWLNQALESLGWIQGPLNLLYSEPAVVVGLLYMYLPLMILPLYSSLERIDPQLEEAATNLGSSPFRVFRTVILPLATPGALIGAVFVFVPSMGNFVIPELLGGGKMLLVGNLVRDAFLKARDWPFGAALALVLTVFLVVLLALQSKAAKRMSEGASDANT